MHVIGSNEYAAIIKDPRSQHLLVMCLEPSCFVNQRNYSPTIGKRRHVFFYIISKGCKILGGDAGNNLLSYGDNAVGLYILVDPFVFGLVFGDCRHTIVVVQILQTPLIQS